MIELKHLRKEYPGVTPVKDLSTVINDGEVVALIGPSGTGKSTILRMINMLERPTSGQIIIDGEDITAPGYPLTQVRGKVAMVFQSFNLFNNMSVIENVCHAPVKLKGVKPPEAFDKGMQLLDAVGMSGCAFKYPDELSGGQKQRVAIARTLAIGPKYILLDEPTSALDPAMVGEVEKVIMDMASQGYTMILVTHDMKFAEKVSTRVIYLDDGVIYEDGTPEQIFRNPQKEKTREFVTQAQEFSCVIKVSDCDYMEFYQKFQKYSEDNDIPPSMKKNVIRVFEELCFQIIIPMLRGKDYDGELILKANQSFRYDTTVISVENIKMDIDWNNPDYQLSYAIIRSCTENISIERDQDGTTAVRLPIKKE